MKPSTSYNVATAPRRHAEIRARRAVATSFRIARAAVRKLLGRPIPRELAVTPTVTDFATVGDLANRIAWYLPGKSVRVRLPVTPEVRRAIEETPVLAIPASQARLTQGMPQNVDVVNANESFAAGTSFLLRDWTKLPRQVTRLRQTLIVDPLFYSMDESMAWATLHYETMPQPERQRQLESSAAIYRRLIEETRYFKSAYVFTTGPSIDKAMQFEYPANSLKIVCNSMVKNTVLLDRIRPQLIVFADPVFHFSPCRYAAEFRKHAVSAALRYGSYVMVPEVHLGLLRTWYPELEGRLIGMPIRHHGGLHVPTPSEFFVRGTGNIMTVFMIPAAAAVPRQIFVLGADGRSPTENYFWKHSSQNQFDDLMQTVFDTHPSFFRDRVYTDYYDDHVKCVNDLVGLVERAGSSVRSLTPSFIPALAARQFERTDPS